MRVCLVGGIFGRPAAYQRLHPHAPETILARGLAERGIEVATVGHDRFQPSDEFDVIHVHHIGRAAYLMACSETRAAFVFTGHDGRMLCGYQRNPIRRSAFRFVVDRSDAAVALSGAEADYYLRRLGHPRVEVIPNGIAACFGQVPLDGERRGLLFVGQLIPLKGVDVLLRALPMMRRHREVELTLAYHGAELEPELRALASELGIAGRVRFAGAQSPEQLAELYARAQLVVLPSHAEALPSVITEALHAGTLVVASRVGGIPGQLNGFGSLVPPGDPAALARGIEDALERPPDLARRHKMRDYAIAEFGTATMAARHAALYQAVAEGGRRDIGRGRERLAPALRGAIAAYWRSPLSLKVG